MENNIMEHQEIHTFEQYLQSITELLGPKKFYTDEFDAFEKYYDQFLVTKEKSCHNLITKADELPFILSCDLAANMELFWKNYEQNISTPELTQVNKNIEFANPNLKLIESKEKGRHLITTGRIQKGAVIINEKVTVLQVNPSCVCLQEANLMYHCHHCAYAVSKFYTCSTCNIVVYCSLDCLKQSHQKYHRFECEGLQRHYWDLNDIDYSYMAFRMVLYGSLYDFNHDIPENDHTKWGNKDNNYPYIYRLQSHFDKLPVKKVYKILQDAVKTIIYLITRTNFFKEFTCNDPSKFLRYVGGLFVRHYCQAEINTVLMKYPNFDVGYAFNVIGGFGKAICPTVAMLNHACSPNAVIIPSGDRVIVMAIKPIPSNTEITIAYKEIDTFSCVQDRQLIMKNFFYFEDVCQCSYCMHELTWQEYPYKCRRCSDGKAKKITLKNEKVRLFCKDCKGHSEVDVRSERAAEIAGNLYKANYGIDPVKRVLQSYEKLFPSNSWMLLDVYRVLLDKYLGLEEKPTETIKYGLIFFKILERYLPRLYPPCLEAKISFYFAVINRPAFQDLEYVSEAEFDTIKDFVEDCLKTKKDIKCYIPDQFLEFYYVGLLSQLEAIEFNLQIVKKIES